MSASLKDLRTALTRRRQELAAEVPAAPLATDDGHRLRVAGVGIALGRRNARILDDLLTGLFAGLESGEIVGGPNAPPPPEAWSRVALASVGSYGRGAVALKSDLDVRLCAPDAKQAALVAEALLYPLWDMGVTIGHQVVSPDELIDVARDDLPTATSLLDWRHIAGAREVSDTLRRRAEETIFAHSELARFVQRLETEARQRHERFGGSVYLLEPDVKNGEGGLRDLDLGRWAAKARFGVGDPDELVRVGAIVPREAMEILEAAELLWRIRNLLHAHAGRRSDRLTFDEQEAIAPLLGFGADADGVERLMSAYYRAARAISRALDMSLARALPVLSRKKPRDDDLGNGVRLFDGSVTMSDVEALRADPTLALRMVGAAVDRGVGLLPYARDAITRATTDATFCETLRASPEAATRFLDLLATTKETAFRAGSVRRELHATGLLVAMIPEFLPVVGRVHHDTYHVYTVDVHSVAAADRLAALVRGELAAEFPLACRLAAEAARPRMLFAATLLHDVGKAIGGTDHSVRGAEMARSILARLGLPAADVEAACHLITKHLLMYHVSTRRDLEEPATIQEFSHDVQGVEGLRDLFLLTVADLSTTSPTSMTAWKARMLDELYRATEAEILSETLAQTFEARPSKGPAKPSGGAHNKRWYEAALEAQRIAVALGEDEADRDARRVFLAEFLESMPERYVIANPPEAVAAHAELAREHLARLLAARSTVKGSSSPPPPNVAVSIVPGRHAGAAVEVCVVATDRPGLLAAITAVLAAGRLEVHGAQIHSRSTRNEGDETIQAVDLFWVRDRGGSTDGVARALPKLTRDLESVLAGDVDETELARSRIGGSRSERAAPRVPIEVSLDDRASPRHTVIEVVARDRPGVLFAVSDALHRLGLSIAVAKINTEGMRVADVFYVSDTDGSKIAPGRRSAEVRARLVQVLESMDAEAVR